jgi:arginase
MVAGKFTTLLYLNRGRAFSMKFQLLSVPDWLGSTHKTGVELGPAALENFILTSDLGKEFARNPLRVSLPKPDHSHLRGKFRSVKYLPEVTRMCAQTKEKMKKIMQAGDIPIVLMGNDSSMVGVFAGISSVKGDNYGVAYFDSHGDINTPETSPSGKLYGMPVAHALGYGHAGLLEINGTRPSLRKENIALLGQRCLDPGEKRFVSANRILLLDTKKLNTTEPRHLAVAALARIGKPDGVFIHIDLDVLEPKESPGVSMHERNGVHVERLIELLDLLTRKSRNVGLSIAEYNPKKDKGEKTKRIVYRILEAYIRNFRHR